MIKNSEKVQELFDSIVEQYDDFWSYAIEELDGTTVEGSARAYEVFDQIEYSENWTYWWNGDVYIMLPYTETESLQRLRDVEKSFLEPVEEPDVENMSMLERLNRGLE
jgi:hypothetical protein